MKHAIAILALGVLAGCGEPDMPTRAEWQDDAEKVLTPAEPEPAPMTRLGRFINVFTDPDTGCQYLLAWGSTPGGITPRLNPDGTQVCTQKDNGE